MQAPALQAGVGEVTIKYEWCISRPHGKVKVLASEKDKRSRKVKVRKGNLNQALRENSGDPQNQQDSRQGGAEAPSVYGVKWPKGSAYHTPLGGPLNTTGLSCMGPLLHSVLLSVQCCKCIFPSL